ncbi:MAG: 1-acyl-sn-glycerol-3-phosphate acyltransferase [bacterium]|nr:1-acyl-sn-glycerol-3-phosphate acyltransferase [bacterium]
MKHNDIAGRVRLVVRLGILAAWTCFCLLLRVLVLPLVLISPWFERVSRQFLFKLWGRLMAFIVGMRVEVRGTRPKYPFLLVCNHQGYVDGFVLASQLACVYISMTEMKSWPLIGTLSKWIHTIFIDRNDMRDTHRVNRCIAQALGSGEGVAFFPEGQTSPGYEVRPFKGALLQPAAENGWPVHYATIRYETPEGCPPATTHVCWAHGEPFTHHATQLFQLPYFNVTITFGDEPIRATNRKELAEQLQKAVAKNLVPNPRVDVPEGVPHRRPA